MDEKIAWAQDYWHYCFRDDYVPDDESMTELVSDYGYQMVIDAIDICSVSDRMKNKSFTSRFAYLLGILRNLKNSSNRKRWGK